jgi:glutamate N-acetyltransferase/amino-acid N-acetyltransferase
MVAALPGAVAALQADSVLPAARGIMTTDMYAKVRSADVPGTSGGRVVGIAKGAGMIEPNLATMLVYLLTDVDVPVEALRGADMSRTVLTLGGTRIFAGGQFTLEPDTERKLVEHLRGAQLWGA